MKDEITVLRNDGLAYVALYHPRDEGLAEHLAIKLMGGDWHQISPVEGRRITPETIREVLALVDKAVSGSGELELH